MTTYREIVKQLSEGASKEDMEKLTDLTSDFLEKVAGSEKLIMKIDMALNPHFTKETAEYAVSKMKNEDKTEGGHWNYDTTTSVLKSKNYPYNPADWFYVLNMVYSDYYEAGQTDDFYIKLANNFLKDKDAPAGKAKLYFLAMNKGKKE